MVLQFRGCLKRDPGMRETNLSLNIDSNDIVKTLGIEWNPSTDGFRFMTEMMASASTKRKVLSVISKLFDPLGLVGPILMAKILM